MAGTCYQLTLVILWVWCTGTTVTEMFWNNVHNSQELSVGPLLGTIVMFDNFHHFLDEIYHWCLDPLLNPMWRKLNTKCKVLPFIVECKHTTVNMWAMFTFTNELTTIPNIQNVIHFTQLITKRKSQLVTLTSGNKKKEY